MNRLELISSLQCKEQLITYSEEEAYLTEVCVGKLEDLSLKIVAR